MSDDSNIDSFLTNPVPIRPHTKHRLRNFVTEQVHQSDMI
jgi:hypothetical protein